MVATVHPQWLYSVDPRDPLKNYGSVRYTRFSEAIR